MKSFLVLAMLIFLSACFTMTKEECFSKDWKALGIADGSKGKPHNPHGWYPAYSKACSKYADNSRLQAEYKLGLEAGLKQFCTYTVGYKQGLNNETNGGVCPKEFEPEFLRGFQDGRKEFRLKSLEKQQENTEVELEKLKKKQKKLNED